MLGTTVTHLAKLRREKKGPPFLKLGAKVRYVKLTLDEWIKDQENDYRRVG